MTRSSTTFVSLAASLMLCGGALAQQQQNRGGAQLPSRDDTDSQLRQFAQDPKTAADKMFVLHAGIGNQFEIDLARQIQQKAQNSQVKQLAQHILDDHQKANEQLQRVAQQVNVRLPQTLPEEKRDMIQILTSLPPDEMEKHYVTAMQADHAADLIKYRATAQMSQNQGVKEYAQQQLPALSQHYDQTQQAAVALGLPSGGPEAMPASGRIQGTPGSGRTGDMTPGGASGSSGATGSGATGSSGSTGSGGLTSPSGTSGIGGSSGSSGSTGSTGGTSGSTGSQGSSGAGGSTGSQGSSGSSGTGGNTGRP